VGLLYTALVVCYVMLTVMFRSQDKADNLCKELEDLNPGSKAIFIKKHISILKNVDEVCEELQRREKKINILFLSAGYMSLSGRKGEVVLSG
jgi:short-subunit dehydrogenase